MAAPAKPDVVILGMGNPLLDISASVKGPEDKILEKYELKMGNAILAEEKHIALYDELVKDYEVEFIAGGSTQNTTRVCQWVLESMADEVNGVTHFIGCVGDDEFGKSLAKSAAADNVKTHYLIDDSVATGTCACIIEDKERSLVANLSAANNYKIAHIQSEEGEAVVKAAGLYYSAGFFLTVSPESALHVAKFAAENDRPYCMNLSAPFIPKFFKQQFEDLLPYMDVIFGNLDESQAFGEAFGLEDTSIESVGSFLFNYAKVNNNRKRIVVLTQGPQPVMVWNGEDKPTTYEVPAIPAEEIVDVNGAGDAFVGGFLAQFASGKDLETAVRCGIYAASVILRVSGTKLTGKADFKP